jgi:hypothetical protein
LPAAIQQVAEQNYELLKADPSHPSLHFKKVGESWPVRAGRGYRALGVETKKGISWVWIGPHAEYDKLLQ